jgi:hypothetical protein
LQWLQLEPLALLQQASLVLLARWRMPPLVPL